MRPLTPDETPPLFSSTRERRFSACTLVVVVAIYSTLGLARTLARLLRDRDLLDISFGPGMLVVGAASVTLARQTRPGGAEIGVPAAYLMMFLRMAIPEEADPRHRVQRGGHSHP